MSSQIEWGWKRSENGLLLCFVATSKGLAKDYANASEPTCAVQPFLHVLHDEVMLLLWLKYF